MKTKSTPGKSRKRTVKKSYGIQKRVSEIKFSKLSPAWVVRFPDDAPGYKMELIDRIRKGVSKLEWKDLIRYIGASEKEFEFVLPTSISSMQKKERYDQETSERIYELSKIFGLGFKVFDSQEKFKQWLDTPSRALGNKKPFELLDSSMGFELVESEIIRIKYNVYS